MLSAVVGGSHPGIGRLKMRFHMPMRDKLIIDLDASDNVQVSPEPSSESSVGSEGASSLEIEQRRRDE